MVNPLGVLSVCGFITGGAVLAAAVIAVRGSRRDPPNPVPRKPSPPPGHDSATEVAGSSTSAVTERSSTGLA